MKLHSKRIFLKSILIAIFLCIVFWFIETLEYSLFNEARSFMDACFYHIPPYSLFIRLSHVVIILTLGGIIGLLFERDHKRTVAILATARD